MKRNVILLHVAFWLVFLLFKFYDYWNNFGIEKALLLVLVPNTFNIIASYLHYFLLLPYLLSRRYLRYLLFLLPVLVLIIFAKGEVESRFFGSLFESTYYTSWSTERVISTFWSTASFIVFISLIKFTIDRFVLENEKKTLENEKLTAELNYLKAQINPHFLFNTLHNLNYLAQAKSDQASSVIVKLSNIMRYMIYEAPKPLVNLSNEISYIKDYLSLESIRLNNQFDLIFDIKCENENIRIAPLLLITLVENAFKHGISDRQKENWLHIHLSEQHGLLNLKVVNSLGKENPEKTDMSGFGLANLQKRLMLAYPNSHNLVFKRHKTHFEVRLDIQLH